MSDEALIADDDETIRAILRHKLSSRGFTVNICHDGQEASDYLDEPNNSPDIVLLDIMMPRKTGIQVLRSIRRGELAVDSDVPVIMLTSRGREDDVLGGLQSGADEYITKPFSPNEVLARVEKLLDN